jgi:hypothetical protein
MRLRLRCSPAQSGAARCPSGVLDLDATFPHASDTGKVVWDFDTVREFDRQ